MPCPKGFKHQVVHPRPNRRKSAIKENLTLVHEAGSKVGHLCPGIESDVFSMSDDAWLREIGIHP